MNLNLLSNYGRTDDESTMSDFFCHIKEQSFYFDRGTYLQQLLDNFGTEITQAFVRCRCSDIGSKRKISII